MINNILASFSALLLLGFALYSSNQSFSEVLPQSQNIGNQSKDSTKMSTSVLGSPNDSTRSLSNVQRVINELNDSGPDEVATYPINDLSPEVVVKVLNGLSVDSLYKVLYNLPHDQLKTLLVDKLTPQESKQILDRLPQDKKTDIQKK